MRRIGAVRGAERQYRPERGAVRAVLRGLQRRALDASGLHIERPRGLARVVTDFDGFAPASHLIDLRPIHTWEESAPGLRPMTQGTPPQVHGAACRTIQAHFDLRLVCFIYT